MSMNEADTRYFLIDSVLRKTPEIMIPLSTITDVDPLYDESFFEDTTGHILTASGESFSFRISSEKGLDRKFVEAIQRNDLEPQGL